MVLKEVLMYFIAFNAIKLLINDNREEILAPDEMSFNSCRQVLNAFYLNASNESFCDSSKNKLSAGIMNVLKKCKLLKRFGRVEPRVQKRRAKLFKLMMKPRAELKEELMGFGSCKAALT
jgi:hypothetical protein